MSDVANVTIYEPDDIRNLPGERVARRDLSNMPNDMVTLTAARGELDARQFGVWSMLRIHLYEYGSLPTTISQLAKIGKVGRATLERMAPALARHFDRDANQRWTDHDLMRARGGRLVIDVEDGPRPKNPRRQEAGRRNVLRRHHPWLFDAQGEVKPDMAEAYDQLMAVLVRKGVPASNVVELPVAFASRLPSVASEDASCAHSLSDGLFQRESERKIEDTDGRTEARSAEPPVSKPDLVVSANVSNPAEHGTGEPLAANARPTLVTASPAALASRVRNVDPLPYTVAEALDGGDTGMPDDDAIIAALRAAGSGKIANEILLPKGIEPIRALLREGCSFPRDIVPAVAAIVPKLTAALRTWKAPFLVDAIRANRDMAIAGAAAAASTAAKIGGFVFIEIDTPQWRAWLEHRRVKSMPTREIRGRARPGWDLPSEWPPGVDPARYT